MTRSAATGARSSRAWSVCALALAMLGAATPDPGAELEAERDALLQRIISGQDYDAAVRRFKALVDERDRRIAATTSLREQERLGVERDRAAVEARRAWRAAYEKTADYEVSWRCTLSPDPAHPIPSTEGRLRPDWGKVVRKERVRLPPKNELDAGEEWTIYEVAGVARRYFVHGESYGRHRDQPLDAKVGDLLLLCQSGRDKNDRLPPPYRDQEIETSGFAVRLVAPPLITAKARWRPIHITGTAFFWAIKDVRWRYPMDGFVLSNIEIGREVEGGRFEIDAGQGLSWLLEAPAALPRRSVLVPGRRAWVILGHPRFDRDLKKLVLVAEDVEERYVREP